MKQFFIAKEVPYFATILFALLSYQLNNIVIRITESPTIEYKFEIENQQCKNDSVKREIKCIFNNVSKDNSFRNLTFIFLYDLHVTTEIFNPKTIVISPSSMDGVKVDCAQNRVASLTIKHIQPGQQYEFLFTTIGKKGATKFPKIFLDTDNTIRLLEHSLNTIIAKNYLGFNIALSLLWLILISIYFHYSSKILQS